MNKKRAFRLVGGGAGILTAGAVLLAISVSARGIENPALESTTILPAAPAETRIELAQTAPVIATYTSEQADRGEDRFGRYCVDCHGDDLNGGLLGGPPLKGLSFEQKFLSGGPASALFLFMSTLMPPEAPGRYSAATYADMMAFILKRNGFRAGAELPSDVAALNNLVLQK